MSRSGIVNVRMVITEEKILSNIDRVHKMINPKSKKQIVQLDEDAYFKDLIESIKSYLVEYPKKKNFPVNVYNAAYDLVEFATVQFEENTKQIENIIRNREKNIELAGVLKDTLEVVQNKEGDWKQAIRDISDDFPEEIIDTLGMIGRARSKKTQNYLDGLKLINARIGNLESNLHIEIDMDRIEDRSKALSYIGIEIADALKLIPKPIKEKAEQIAQKTEQEVVTKEKAKVSAVVEQVEENNEEYIDENYVDVKPSLWQRIKNSKLIKGIQYIMKIKVVVQLPDALPEGRGENV